LTGAVPRPLRIDRGIDAARPSLQPDPAVDAAPGPGGAEPAAFTTARLAIEPLSLDHAAGLHAALDHADVHRFLRAPDVTTLDALRARIERLAAAPPPAGERWWNFAVRLRADRSVIGRLEATTCGDWGEIAYVFGPRWWGQGLASEATAWLVRQLADHGAPELWAAVHPGNTASQRLLARLGFQHAAPARPLASFDPGDDAFVRRG
jgi:RimJ/RimL family protein N-acetyltransferase